MAKTKQELYDEGFTEEYVDGYFAGIAAAMEDACKFEHLWELVGPGADEDECMNCGIRRQSQ